MKPDRIEQLIKTVRVRSRPDTRERRLDDILAAHDRWRQSQAASGRVFPGWVAKVAVAASVAIIVTFLVVMHRSPDRAVPDPVQIGAVSSPAEIITAGSLQRTFCQAGLEGVERQLDRATELFGPWPTVLPEQGLL